jgi:hypothetical protein
VSASPRSTERKVLIAGAATLLFLCLFLGIPAFVRPPPLEVSLGGGFLTPFLALAWLMTVCLLAVSRQWRPALLAALFFIGPAAVAIMPLGPIEYTLRKAAQRLEFAIHRSSYDDLVTRTPKGEAPRLILVSQRDVDDIDMKSRFEEIWFDEADELGSADSSIRDARFQASHPKRPDQWKPTYYAIQPLGGHYYFIDVTYPY